MKDEYEELIRPRPRRVKLAEKLDTIGKQPRDKFRRKGLEHPHEKRVVPVDLREVHRWLAETFPWKKCVFVRDGQTVKRFSKRQAHKAERRMGKELGDDAPKKRRNRGWSS